MQEIRPKPRKLRIHPVLGQLIEKMARAHAATRGEAFAALWEADEIVIVDGVVRLIIPTRPDGRIVG